MSEPAENVLVCNECSAPNFSKESTCWLCHAQLMRAHENVVSDFTKPSPDTIRTQEISNHDLFKTTLLCLLLSLLIGVGLALTGSPFLILHILVVIPALMITGTRSWIRKLQGKEVNKAHLNYTFAISSAAFGGILVLLGLTCIVAFFTICARPAGP